MQPFASGERSAVLLAENAKLVRERQGIMRENHTIYVAAQKQEEALTAENAELFVRAVSAESGVERVSRENVLLREENQRLIAQLQARQVPQRALRFFPGVSDAMPAAPSVQHNAASGASVTRGYGRR